MAQALYNNKEEEFNNKYNVSLNNIDKLQEKIQAMLNKPKKWSVFTCFFDQLPIMAYLKLLTTYLQLISQDDQHWRQKNILRQAPIVGAHQQFQEFLKR